MLRRTFLVLAFLAPASAALAEDPDEKKRGGGLSFMQLPTLTATCMRRNHTRGVITVEVGLDIKDSRLRELAELSQPRLRASFNTFLSSYVAGLPPGSPVDADYLSGQFQRRTDQVLGKPGAKLLIGSILMN